ncbi:MAG: hypothetical protein KGM44_12700, partial [bacterium]|nr:hypothetical protein [bacterium]
DASAQRADEHGDYGVVDPFFADWWPRLMRFRGEHPSAARETIARMRVERAEHFARVEEIVRRRQSPLLRARNVLRSLNYAQRWRLRALSALRYGLL